LVFEQTLPTQSDITFGGRSILAALENTSWVVEDRVLFNHALYLPSVTVP